MKKELIFKVLRIRVAILISFVLIFVVALGVYIYRNPYMKISWMMRYPSRTYDTKICTFKSPSGWDVCLGDDSRPNKILTMSTGLFDYQDLYFEVCSPYIVLHYDKNFNAERTFRHTMRVLDEVHAYEESKVINSVRYTIFRYQGNQLLCFDSSSTGNLGLKYEEIEKENSVVIAFYNERGCYGLFCGLLEQENDFWKMINSINWRNN